MPKEKRPTEYTIWWGSPEDIEEWFNKVFDRKKNAGPDNFTFVINEDEIE